MSMSLILLLTVAQVMFFVQNVCSSVICKTTIPTKKKLVPVTSYHCSNIYSDQSSMNLIIIDEFLRSV